jgi:hypothetical protein
MRRAQTAVWPAPIRGLQLSGTYVGAPPNAAEVLDNFIPTATGARLRGGATLFARVDAAVDRLMVYRSGAVEEMFATTAGKIVNVSSAADPEIAEGADVIGLTSGDWSFQQWATAGGQFLLCVNGADRYCYYNGAAWNPITDEAVNNVPYKTLTANFAVGETVTGGTSGATAQIRLIERLTDTTGVLRVGNITGGPFQNNEALTSATGAAVADGASSSGSAVTLTGITGQQLSFVWSHKARVWFVEKGTLNAWYLPTNAFGGTAVKFPLTGIFRMGGALLFGGTWTVDSGTGIDDMQVFVTTEGEVAIYQGTDPAAASTWTIAGLYRIARPINKHSWFQSGADFYIVTEEGIVSVADVMSKDRAQIQATAMTAAIEDLWRATVQKKVAGSKFALTVWPSENLFLIGVPSTTGQRTALVANTLTGAWSRILGWDVEATRVFNDRLYFGTNDGLILRADSGGRDEFMRTDILALTDEDGNVLIDEDGNVLITDVTTRQGNGYVGVYVPKFQEFNTPEQKFALHGRALWRSDVPASVRLVAYTNYNSNTLPAIPAPLPENLSGKWGSSGKWGGGAKWGATEPVVSGSDWQAVTGAGYALAPGMAVNCNRVATPVFEIMAAHMRYETGSAI